MRNHAARRRALSDAIIINTCAVTAEAERQARQAIRKARRSNPEARIIVTGCAAQIAPEKLRRRCRKSITVLGNAEKLEAESFQAHRRRQRHRPRRRRRHHAGDGDARRI